MSITIEVVSPQSIRFDAIRALRMRHIGDNPAGEGDFEKSEECRDLCSYHFIYLDNEEVVGTLRITPMGHGLNFAEELLDLKHYFAKPHSTFDANRLVLDVRYRGGIHLHNFLLQVSSWLLIHTAFRHICVLCRTKLAAIYVDIGGKVLAKHIPWDTQGVSRSYSLVSLELETVYQTINRKKSNGNVLRRAG